MSARRRNSAMDTEKRWSDPEEFRRAMTFTCVVIAIALATLCSLLLVDRSSGLGTLAFAPAAVFLVGGLIAFAQTYRVWKRGGVWPIWQGAGWGLMVLMLISSGFGAGAYGPLQ
ncbi:hypothetical protein ACFRFQ_00825 [Rhodococcus sp. NPDC056743]|uniref:hypothetical protein n=1 Tax=Rhodococcus sp. NPDC056743 TaxID=3345934 RepID=UPI00366C010F